MDLADSAVTAHLLDHQTKSRIVVQMADLINHGFRITRKDNGMTHAKLPQQTVIVQYRH